MKNDYKICGDITIIYLKHKNGKVCEATIDTDDLERIFDFNITIRPVIYRKEYPHLVYASFHNPLTQEECLLHRFIVDAPKGFVVDHINHDTTDNRKANLRIVTQAINGHNRSGLNRNNTKGVSGISYHKGRNRPWQACIKVNYRHKSLGYYETKQEAGMVAKAAKERLISGLPL